MKAKSSFIKITLEEIPNLFDFPAKVFNFGITKNSATPKITEFHKIRPKFRQKFVRDLHMKYAFSKNI